MIDDFTVRMLQLDVKKLKEELDEVKKELAKTQERLPDYRLYR